MVCSVFISAASQCSFNLRLTSQPCSFVAQGRGFRWKMVLGSEFVPSAHQFVLPHRKVPCDCLFVSFIKIPRKPRSVSSDNSWEAMGSNRSSYIANCNVLSLMHFLFGRRSFGKWSSHYPVQLSLVAWSVKENVHLPIVPLEAVHLWFGILTLNSAKLPNS